MTIIGGSRPRCFVSGGVTLAALCALTYIPPADADTVFTGVGILEGGVYRVSRAQAVSADGMTVVGASQSGSGYEAFRWTFANGIVGLGDLPGGDFRSEAVDVSADGSVIVGWSESAAGVSQEAFRWEAGAMAGLGDLPGGHFFSEAAAVSYDGDVVVGGSSCELGWEAFRWTTADGLV